MNYNKKTLRDIDLKNKIVLLRLDLNVPIKNGVVADDKRIRAALPTIQYLVDQNCKIVIFSHLSRIKSLADKDGKKSLLPVYNDLSKKLPNSKIEFCPKNVDRDLKAKIDSMAPKSILLLENTRYNDVNENGEVVKFESKNDPRLGLYWASLGDVFVNDAFGTCHRSHASNVGIASNIKDSCIGFLIEKELDMLSKSIDNPQHPVVAIFGGAKVSDKIKSIENFSKLADLILIGGGMSYTFISSNGGHVGKSLVEEDSLVIAKDLIDRHKQMLVFPVDSNCTIEFADMPGKLFPSNNIPEDYMGLDIGKKSIKDFTKIIKRAKTIIWNGPLGVCEFANYSKGTEKVCKAIAKATSKGAFSVIGGGDSAAAAIKLGYENSFSHISTGGGASIAFFEGSPLPGIESIKNKI